MKRYFLVGYCLQLQSTGETKFSNWKIQVNNFPTEKELRDALIAHLEKTMGKIPTLVILSMCEMSKEDHDKFLLEQ